MPKEKDYIPPSHIILSSSKRPILPRCAKRQMHIYNKGSKMNNITIHKIKQCYSSLSKSGINQFCKTEGIFTCNTCGTMYNHCKDANKCIALHIITSYPETLNYIRNNPKSYLMQNVPDIKDIENITETTNVEIEYDKYCGGLCHDIPEIQPCHLKSPTPFPARRATNNSTFKKLKRIWTNKFLSQEPISMKKKWTKAFLKE